MWGSGVLIILFIAISTARCFRVLMQITTCVNQIEEVCDHFRKTINLVVQNTLNELDGHCDQVMVAAQKAVEAAE